MKWRFRIVILFFVLSFLAIEIKLFNWQVIKAEELAMLGQAQYAKNVKTIPKRGEIKTSDGFSLVANKLTYLVFANPKQISNKDQAASLLSSSLQLDIASVSARLSEDLQWVSIKSNIDSIQKDALTSLHISGIGFEDSPTRYYPEGSMAAQLVGFVGKDEAGNDKGYFGLEGYYDRQLKGRIGVADILSDALGRPILARLDDLGSQQDGRSLVLTINRTIQYFLEQKLKKGLEEYGAKSASAVVMDPKTGGILALASFPSFDPKTYYNFDQSSYVNPIISDSYEPGSTFKPLVMSYALDKGLITPNSVCTICSGPVAVGDYKIHTWDDKYFPNTNMISVMQHSDNTGMVYISKLLGLSKMIDGLTSFGIGDMTGIDLQGEVSPDLRPKEKWYPIDVATASFGQGISVTPIQLLDAFSALANNGVRMQPHVVSQIITPDGKTISISPKELSRPISSATAKIMTQILVQTVNKGEASFARLKGYSIAGKTGTASIPLAGHYDPTKTIASFIGYAPADDPKFIMLVVFNQPTSSIYGAETAAPVFFDIAKDIINTFGIPPTGE